MTWSRGLHRCEPQPANPYSFSTVTCLHLLAPVGVCPPPPTLPIPVQQTDQAGASGPATAQSTEHVFN